MTSWKYANFCYSPCCRQLPVTFFNKKGKIAGVGHLCLPITSPVCNPIPPQLSSHSVLSPPSRSCSLTSAHAVFFSPSLFSSLSFIRAAPVRLSGSAITAVLGCELKLKRQTKKNPILHCVCEDQHWFLWSSPGSQWIYLQTDRRGRSISSWSCDQMNQSGSHSLDTAVYGVLIFRAVLNATTLLSKMTFYNTAATVCQLVSAFYLMGNPRHLRVLKHFVIRGVFFCII